MLSKDSLVNEWYMDDLRKIVRDSPKKMVKNTKKEKMTKNREAYIVSLRKEIQKKDIQQKFGNITKTLEEIISNKKPFYDKSGLV